MVGRKHGRRWNRLVRVGLVLLSPVLLDPELLYGAFRCYSVILYSVSTLELLVDPLVRS